MGDDCLLDRRSKKLKSRKGVNPRLNMYTRKSTSCYRVRSHTEEGVGVVGQDKNEFTWDGLRATGRRKRRVFPRVDGSGVETVSFRRSLSECVFVLYVFTYPTPGNLL